MILKIIAGTVFIVCLLYLILLAIWMKRTNAQIKKRLSPYRSETGGDYPPAVNSMNTIRIDPVESELSPHYARIGEDSLIGTREYQQDAIKSAVMTDAEGRKIKRAIGILCDGMGGMEGGEKASNLCVDTLFKDFQQLEAGVSFPHFLLESLHKLDALVFNLRDEGGRRLRAGTTITAVIMDENHLYWASAGDSRIYIIREAEIAQITVDHNLLSKLMKLVEAGKLSLEEAMAEEQREALTSYLGMGGITQIDWSEKPVELLSGDVVLLCSDGLYRSLDDQEILDLVLRNKHNMTEMVCALVHTAVSRNLVSHDNTSVIVLYYLNQDEANKSMEGMESNEFNQV